MVTDSEKYPIGSFQANFQPTLQERQDDIDQISELVVHLKEAVYSFHPDDWQKSYRDGGWTIHQIVHHLADNDMNAYLRFKRALTEQNPIAASYREELWAELADYSDVPLQLSISLLEALHKRFYVLLASLQPEQFSKTLVTSALGSITLDIALQRFIWHHRHHLAHIVSVKERYSL
ncbi:YfiT family bacillithiol transferase [Paenibacillus sp. GCM10027627]|uniref:YfiT family bacillithiol transferase n=1 Tax=unclassified Paenibacillus TaxID=185978 RepID=UPI0036336B06